MTDIEVQTVRDPAALNEMDAEWRALERTAARGCVFQHPAWVLAWWEKFVRNQTVWVQAARWKGRLLGLAPLWIADTTHGRVARFLGAPLNDFNDFLVEPGNPEPVVAALWTAILDGVAAWETFELGPVRPDAALRLGGFPTASGLLVEPGIQQPAPELVLADGWEDYRLGLAARARSAWERALERALAAHVVTVRPIHDPDLIGAELTRVETLRQATWAARGRHHKLVPAQRDPGFAGFLAEATSRLAADDRCLLVELLLDETLVAADLYLLADQQALLYLRMFRPESTITSPGMVLALLGLRVLHARGIRRVSLGRGGEPYKYRLGAIDVILDRPTLRRVA